MNVAPISAEYEGRTVPPANRSAGAVGGRATVSLLTTYLVLLLWLPSQSTIAMLGSVGRPSTLWGLLCLAFWGWGRINPHHSARPPRGGLVVSLLAVFVCGVLISYSLAQVNGLPHSELSPANSMVLRLFSWAGVLLVAHDGLRTREQFDAITRRLVSIGGVFALLGLVQFVTRQTWIDRVEIPLLATDTSMSSLIQRGDFVRVSATAFHPLEYAVVLSATLPVALALAFNGTSMAWLRRWWAAIVITFASVMSVSRSAIIGLILGVTLFIPGLPKRYRTAMIAGSVVLMLVVYVAVPGLAGTIKGMFIGAGNDSSTQSRTSALAVVLEISGNYGIFGRGFGTFLPQYQIMDNQYLGLLVEAGVFGLLAFLGIAVAACIRARRAKIRFLAAGAEDQALVSHALMAAMVATTALFAFFDALGFVQSAGMFFLLAGLCSASFNLSADDSSQHSAPV